MSLLRNVTIQNLPQDRFERVMVAAPQTLFDNTFRFDSAALLWEYATGTGATAVHDTATASMGLSISSGTGATSASAQTYEYFIYEPGKSQQITMSINIGAAVSGLVKRVGYFDSRNGVFLEQDGTNGLYFVRRSDVSGSVVDTRVHQSSWSEDKLDGTGVSKVTLDITKVQIVQFDAQWLGVGAINCGFNVDGHLLVAHEFHQANIGSVVYCRTFSLPLRYEISRATTTATSGTLTCICAAVASSGGVQDEMGYRFVASNSTTLRSVPTGGMPLLMIRPALTMTLPEGGTTANRANYSLKDITVFNAGNAPVVVQVVYNPDLSVLSAAGSWSPVNAHSGMTYNVTATGAVSASEVVLDTFYVPAVGTSRFAVERALATRFPVGLNAAADTAKSVVVMAFSTSATQSCGATIGWKEVR